ncbi:MAG: hypothetical protein AAF583_03510 [Pseudomonadota bacterium]
MSEELENKLYLEIEPVDENAFAEAVQRGSIAELKSVLLASADAEQRDLVEKLLPPELVATDRDDFDLI